MNTVNLTATVKMGLMGIASDEPMYELFVAKSDDLHEVITEDGISTDVNACVGLRRIDGKEWHHGRLFTGGFEHMECNETGFSADVYRSASTQAHALLERIRERGIINLDHWDAVN